MTPIEPKLACTVLLVRDRDGLEVLMVERHERSHFASALVFPGGLVDPEDGEAEWGPLTAGADGLSPKERSLRIAGFRELHEESGILLARRQEAGVWTPPPPGERPFREMLADLGLHLDLAAMHPFAHWITPPFAPKRFDTHFRLCGVDTDHIAVSDGQETVSAEWIRPRAALEMGASGARKLLLPTRLNLQLLAKASSVAEAIGRAKERTVMTVITRLEQRPEGTFVIVPPDAGYGVVEERLTNYRP
jgi:8-oxo-dGTP pyrophosphatase MutT (NUDIX family)